MLNYIFKCTSGSFFRTIGRILVYFIIGFIIACFSGYINISKANAESYLDYGSYKTTSDVYFANCSSKDNCSSLIQAHNTGGSVIPYFVSNSNLNTVSKSSGIGLTFRSEEGFIAGNYYTITIFVSNVNGGRVTATTTNTKQAGTGYSEYNAINYATTATKMTTNGVILRLFKTNDEDSLYFDEYVAALSYTFVAPVTGNYFFATFTTEKTVTSIWNFYGYNYTSHGSKAPTTEEINQALQGNFTEVNSNINNATNSINNNIDNSTNQINQNIDEMKQKQQETNDYLMDDTPPDSDISSLGNVQGLLPPGPVDSLLNIPFEFLSIVTSSLSGTCAPLSSKFVFDSELTYPCFSEMFYDKVPDGLMIFINIIPSAFILIFYFKHLYKKVDRAMSLESNSDDEWGVI